MGVLRRALNLFDSRHPRVGGRSRRVTVVDDLLVEEVGAVESALEVGAILILIHLHDKTLVPLGRTSIDCPVGLVGGPRPPDVKARLPLGSNSALPRKDE